MKILLVNKFHNVRGGSETYYFGLGRMLEKAGCDVIYFSMMDEANEPCATEKYFVKNVDFNAEMNPIKTVYTSLRLLYSFEARNKFERLVKDENPDIIHLNLFQSQLTGSIVDIAEKYKIPVVYTAHDLKCICPNYKMLNNGEICEKCLNGNYFNCFKFDCMKNSKLKSLLATIEAYVYKFRGTYRKIDTIIAPSKFYQKKIIQANIVKCPVVHMTNFLPLNTEYKLSNKGNYLLFFGRLSEEKGLISLLKAYAATDVSYPLYIVGRGPMGDAIKAFIDKNGLGGRVYLLGFKSQSELKHIIQGCLCVCLTSEWYENCPCSVMEAMAFGKPVIANNIGGLPEIVKDGKTGFVVPAFNTDALKNAIERICNMSEDDLIRMGMESISFAKEYYNNTEYLGKLMCIYKSLLSKRFVENV